MTDTIAIAAPVELVRWLAEHADALCRAIDAKIRRGDFVLTPEEAAALDESRRAWEAQTREEAEHRAAEEDEYAAAEAAEEMEWRKRIADEAAQRGWEEDEAAERALQARREGRVSAAEAWALDEEERRAREAARRDAEEEARKREAYEAEMEEEERAWRDELEARDSLEARDAIYGLEGPEEDAPEPFGRPPGSEGPTKRQLLAARYRWAQVEHAARAALGEDVGPPLEEAYAPGTRHEWFLGGLTVVSFDRETGEIVLEPDVGGSISWNAAHRRRPAGDNP